MLRRHWKLSVVIVVAFAGLALSIGALAGMRSILAVPLAGARLDGRRVTVRQDQVQLADLQAGSVFAVRLTLADTEQTES